MLDRILAIISMLGLVAFMGWVNYRVMEPDLWVATLSVMAIAVYYFWQELREGGSHWETDQHGDSES